MKVGDVIRIPKGAQRAFNLKSDIGIVVSTRRRVDDYPDDLNVMIDSIIHAMGFQLEQNSEVISEAG